MGREVLRGVSLPERGERQLLSTGEAAPFLFGGLGLPDAFLGGDDQFGDVCVAVEGFIRKVDGEIVRPLF